MRPAIFLLAGMYHIHMCMFYCVVVSLPALLVEQSQALSEQLWGAVQPRWERYGSFCLCGQCCLQPHQGNTPWVREQVACDHHWLPYTHQSLHALHSPITECPWCKVEELITSHWNVSLVIRLGMEEGRGQSSESCGTREVRWETKDESWQNELRAEGLGWATRGGK